MSCTLNVAAEKLLAIALLAAVYLIALKGRTFQGGLAL